MLHISVLMSPVGGYWNRCNFTAPLRRARVNPPHRKSFSQTCFRISAWQVRLRCVLKRKAILASLCFLDCDQCHRSSPHFLDGERVGGVPPRLQDGSGGHRVEVQGLALPL